MYEFEGWALNQKEKMKTKATETIMSRWIYPVRLELEIRNLEI